MHSGCLSATSDVDKTPHLSHSRGRLPKTTIEAVSRSWGNGIHDDSSASLFSTLDRDGMADRRARRRLCPVPATGHRSDGGTPLLAGRPLHNVGRSQPGPRDTRTGLSGSATRPALCHPASAGSDRSLVGRKWMCLRSLPLHGAHVHRGGPLLWGTAVLWGPTDVRHHGSLVCGDRPFVRHCSTAGCGGTSGPPRSAPPRRRSVESW